MIAMVIKHHLSPSSPNLENPDNLNYKVRRIRWLLFQDRMIQMLKKFFNSWWEAMESGSGNRQTAATYPFLKNKSNYTILGNLLFLFKCF